LACTNSSLVVGPPRPHWIELPATAPTGGPVSERTCEDPEARDCCVRPDRGQCPVFCRRGHRHGWTFSQPWKSWVVVATS